MKQSFVPTILQCIETISTIITVVSTIYVNIPRVQNTPLARLPFGLIRFTQKDNPCFAYGVMEVVCSILAFIAIYYLTIIHFLTHYGQQSNLSSPSSSLGAQQSNQQQQQQVKSARILRVHTSRKRLCITTLWVSRLLMLLMQSTFIYRLSVIMGFWSVYEEYSQLVYTLGLIIAHLIIACSIAMISYMFSIDLNGSPHTISNEHRHPIPNKQGVDGSESAVAANTLAEIDQPKKRPTSGHQSSSTVGSPSSSSSSSSLSSSSTPPLPVIPTDKAVDLYEFYQQHLSTSGKRFQKHMLAGEGDIPATYEDLVQDDSDLSDSDSDDEDDDSNDDDMSLDADNTTTQSNSTNNQRIMDRIDRLMESITDDLLQKLPPVSPDDDLSVGDDSNHDNVDVSGNSGHSDDSSDHDGSNNSHTREEHSSDIELRKRRL